MVKSNTTARRAILPEVMLAEDVALALGVTREEASRLMACGSLGPCRQIGAHLYVTREGLLSSIEMSRHPRNAETLRAKGMSRDEAP
jgi:hypothetical protein